MRKPVIALLSSLTVALSLAACSPATNNDVGDDGETVLTSKHESAPASPIAFGISVPHGSTQLGPLVRWRSPALIKSYQAELDAIEAEEEAERLEQIEERRLEDPSWTPPTPTPSATPDATSTRDSFAKLETHPRADTFVSLMQINGKPTLVVRSLLAQLSVLLPEADIVTDDLAEYCTAKERRVVRCELTTNGETPGGRTLDVHLSVDPGDVTTRTGRAASNGRPVMTLYIRETGDVREAQKNRTPERLPSPPDVTKSDEKTAWIWPKMDESVPVDGPVIADWTAPEEAIVLLTGKRPQFATMSTQRISTARDVAADFTANQLGKRTPSVDILADLNETLVSTYGTNSAGKRVRAVRIASARGNFVSLFLMPQGW